MSEVRGLGHSVKRKEDPRFIRGKGRFIDDIKAAGDAISRHRAQSLRSREDQEHQ